MVVDYLCYECRNEIDKELKSGKKLVELIGNGFTILGYGLRIKRLLFN